MKLNGLGDWFDFTDILDSSVSDGTDVFDSVYVPDLSIPDLSIPDVSVDMPDFSFDTTIDDFTVDTPPETGSWTNSGDYIVDTPPETGTWNSGDYTVDTPPEAGSWSNATANEFTVDTPPEGAWSGVTRASDGSILDSAGRVVASGSSANSIWSQVIKAVTSTASQYTTRSLANGGTMIVPRATSGVVGYNAAGQPINAAGQVVGAASSSNSLASLFSGSNSTLLILGVGAVILLSMSGSRSN